MATPPVARAEPDGYTIMTALPSLAVIPEGNRLAGVSMPDSASRSALVLDDDPLSQRVREMGGERAGRVVGDAARRKRHHKGDRSRWIGLRVRDYGPGRRRAGDERNELAAPHVLPLGLRDHMLSHR